MDGYVSCSMGLCGYALMWLFDYSVMQLCNYYDDVTHSVGLFVVRWSCGYAVTWPSLWVYATAARLYSGSAHSEGSTWLCSHSANSLGLCSCAVTQAYYVGLCGFMATWWLGILCGSTQFYGDSACSVGLYGSGYAGKWLHGDSNCGSTHGIAVPVGFQIG